MARRSRFSTTPQENEKLTEVKRQLCRVLRKSMALKPHANQSWLALQLRTSRACVCRVQMGDTKNITFNQLMRYLVRLEPEFQILISI